MDQFDGNNIARFDAYLRGEMLPDARRDFEARLAAEPDFKRAFELHRALLGSIGRNLERTQFREQVRMAHAAVVKKPKPRFRPWLLPGIALLLILAAGIWYFWQSPKTSGTVKPTPPQSQDSTIRSAAGQSAKFERAVRATGIQLVNGKRKSTNAGMYQFAAFEFDIQSPVSTFSGDTIQVFFPKGQLPVQVEFKLFELTKKSDTSLYLQVENTLYAIPPGKHALIEVADKQVLDWLK